MLARVAAAAEGTVRAFPEFLDHLAATDRHILHDSDRHGITTFRTERASPDASAFGRERAVFGTHDPH